MKEKEGAREKTVVVDVSLIRELVVTVCCILSTAALLAYLMLTGGSAVAASEISYAQIWRQEEGATP